MMTATTTKDRSNLPEVFSIRVVRDGNRIVSSERVAVPLQVTGYPASIPVDETAELVLEVVDYEGEPATIGGTCWVRVFGDDYEAAIVDGVVRIRLHPEVTGEIPVKISGHNLYHRFKLEVV